MARVFITGSADGLGELAARSLLEMGHRVVLHARNEERAREALKKNRGAETALVADLSNMEEVKTLALHVNELGSFDAIIHNAGVYRTNSQQIFAVNTLAPYILTCCIQKPKRLIYLSSSMHLSGAANLHLFEKNGNGITYSDSKFHVLLLCLSVARKWADVCANAVDPGWVPTKMGGSGAPDNLQKGYETQVWLAADPHACINVSGKYFYHHKEKRHHPDASDKALQERFLDACGKLTGVSFPEAAHR